MSTRVGAVFFAALLVFGATTAFRSTVPRTTRCSTIYLLAATNEGDLVVTRDNEKCKLAYKIVRPMSLSSRQAAPIVVLGPSDPSDYPLADHIPYRSIVFHNQIGKSCSEAVDDLQELLKKIGVRRFPLYGHYHGGIVAFEYMKRLAERNDNKVECLSAVLSSTPTSTQVEKQETERLLSNLSEEFGTANEEEISDSFRRKHVCRMSEIPQQLLADDVRHDETLLDYKAEPPSQEAFLHDSTW